MWHSQPWMMLMAILLSSSCLVITRGREGESGLVKTSVFLSPPFYLKPGSVKDKYYFDIPFPRGHIALKNFHAEVIDENQNSVPLHETYLHHWVVGRYFGGEGSIDDADYSKIILVRNSGPCRNLGQYFGLGSETRRTDTWVPDPYGIEVGNPTEIPEGYEERWLLNVHAIDTRGVEDRLGCTECKCDLYNVTADKYGRPLANGYVGGLYCCYDQTHCRVRGGYSGSVRKLYLKYTVKWVDWNPSIVPVKIHIFDVTDTGDHPSHSSTTNSQFSCKTEYKVPPCDSVGEENENCIDYRRTKVVLPHGGDIVYGVAHQHTGGRGSALYGEDGRLLCSSSPRYGNGEESGNEAGYIVGMSSCYPKPGSVSINDGELVTVVSNYSSAQMHTGVMGLFYILVAEPQTQQNALLSWGLAAPWFTELAGSWWVILFAGGIIAAVAAAIFLKRSENGGYQMVSTGLN
ncbi:hypothetical protein KSP39_PZI003877 [Platanthera zijinensis]|uniref:Stress up-regulated Nod 19 n=1 Tax=Platanthera zijinensis TaxID=2320716 RepID=A0AAP0BWA0_9ASPA